MTAIVRHKKTNTLYRHLDGDRYRNLSTGVDGEVSPEISQKIFAINLDATALLNGENGGNIEKMIKCLNLKTELNHEL